MARGDYFNYGDKVTVSLSLRSRLRNAWLAFKGELPIPRGIQLRDALDDSRVCRRKDRVKEQRRFDAALKRGLHRGEVDA